MKASSFWDVTVPRVLSIYANLIFLLLWVGFIVALLSNPGWLDLLWNWVQALPVVPRVIVWLVFLPITVGLWIWESSWPAFGRILGLTGIIAWTLTAASSLYRAFKH